MKLTDKQRKALLWVDLYGTFPAMYHEATWKSLVRNDLVVLSFTGGPCTVTDAGAEVLARIRGARS